MSTTAEKGKCWWVQESLLVQSSQDEALPAETSLLMNSKSAFFPELQGLILQSQAQFEDSS